MIERFLVILRLMFRYCGKFGFFVMEIKLGSCWGVDLFVCGLWIEMVLIFGEWLVCFGSDCIVLLISLVN